MTRLTKSEIEQFTQIFLLANTSLSLFRGMTKCIGMEKLRNWSALELKAFYDHATARAKRGEVVVSLCYAALCAAILQARETGMMSLDSSRLDWGDEIWNHARDSTSGDVSHTD